MLFQSMPHILERIIQTVTILAICFVSVMPLAIGADEDLVTVYIPAFEGPGALGSNVATILNLQIWQTLRKAPTPNPTHLNFGRGLVIWDPHTLSEQSFRAAEEFSRIGILISSGYRVYPQLVLWGKARQYGDGVIVESFLTIPPSFSPSATTRNYWDVTVPLKDSRRTIVADLPRRRYEFSAISLDNGVVQRYTLPTALTIYDLRTGKNPIGKIGVKFEAREHRGTSVVVESDGVVGLVHLPELSRNEVVDFAGGVMRIFRGDWQGALTMFQRVVLNPKAPSSLKADALLYQIFAKSSLGLDVESEIKRARALTPYSRSMVVYTAMAQLEQLSRRLEHRPLASSDRYLLNRIRSELSSNQVLFSPDDPWLATVTALLKELDDQLPVP